MGPTPDFQIRPGDDLPLYRQIVRQVQDAVVSGRLEPGQKLASHRELAEHLVVAPLTVKKAYDHLEAAGWIETRRGRGTFVCATARMAEDERLERLRPAARRLAGEAWRLGVDVAGLRGLIEEEARGLEAEREKEEDEG